MKTKTAVCYSAGCRTLFHLKHNAADDLYLQSCRYSAIHPTEMLRLLIRDVDDSTGLWCTIGADGDLDFERFEPHSPRIAELDAQEALRLLQEWRLLEELLSRRIVSAIEISRIYEAVATVSRQQRGAIAQRK